MIIEYFNKLLESEHLITLIFSFLANLLFSISAIFSIIYWVKNIKKKIKPETLPEKTAKNKIQIIKYLKIFGLNFCLFWLHMGEVFLILVPSKKVSLNKFIDFINKLINIIKNGG